MQTVLLSLSPSLFRGSSREGIRRANAAAITAVIRGAARRVSSRGRFWVVSNQPALSNKSYRAINLTRATSPVIKSDGENAGRRDFHSRAY